jgi:Holliday junction resolvase
LKTAFSGEQMTNDQETSIVIDTLTKDMGFEAERIPEQHSGKRADIWARKGEDYFLFEVKSPEDHPALMP